MPLRDFYGYAGGSTGQNALHGAATGIQDSANQLVRQAFLDKQQQRELAKTETLRRDAEAAKLVQSGEWTPQQAAAHSGLPAARYTGMQEAPQTTLAKVMGQLQSGMSDLEATTAMQSHAPFRNTPPVETPSPFSEPGSLDYESPIQQKVSQLLEGKNAQELSNEKPQEIGETASVGPTFGQRSVETETGNVPEQPFGADVTPLKIYGVPDRRTGGFHVTDTVPSGPSAQTAGAAEGAKELAGAPGKASAQVLVENELRAPKVKTAQALQQSQIDTETSPANVQKEARRAAAIEFDNNLARDQASKVLGDKVSQSFVNGIQSTNGVRPYVYFPTGTDARVQAGVLQSLAANPATKGMRPLNAQDHQSMQQVKIARANYDNIVNLLKDKLAKTYGSNWAIAPANKIDELLQSDPELVAAEKDFGQVVQGLRAQAGPFGRITYQEIKTSKGSFPDLGNTLPSILAKRELFGNSLNNVVDGVLGGK